jgi:hypothetical protein
MPANPTIIFDIETGPLPINELVIPPFDPSQVKLGNIKNPDLIAEKIQKAEENHVTDYIKNAALDALSGQVLCIGYRLERDEPAILSSDADGGRHAPAMVGAAEHMGAPATVDRVQREEFRPAVPH